MKREICEYSALLALISTVFVASCATMTDAEREEREYRRAEWRQQFIAHRDECTEVGGRLEFDGSSGQDRYGIPKYKVRYICTLPPMAVVNR